MELISALCWGIIGFGSAILVLLFLNFKSEGKDAKKFLFKVGSIMVLSGSSVMAVIKLCL